MPSTSAATLPVSPWLKPFALSDPEEDAVAGADVGDAVEPTLPNGQYAPKKPSGQLEAS